MEEYSAFDVCCVVFVLYLYLHCVVFAFVCLRVTCCIVLCCAVLYRLSEAAREALEGCFHDVVRVLAAHLGSDLYAQSPYLHYPY